jgi:ABC-type uncharacterized transport system involved in gliding motility auxiliary subunit
MSEEIRRERRTGNILLILAGVAFVVAIGFLLIERKLSLGSEISLSVALALLIAFVIVEPARTRTWVTGRQVRYGSNAVLMSLVLFVILALGNYLADRHAYRVDVTADRRLSLSQQTIDVLEAMEGRIEVVGFFPSGTSQDQARDLLSQYEHFHSDWEMAFYDPVVEPSRAMEWGVTDTWSPTVFILYEGRREQVRTVSEQQLTSALVRLTRTTQPKVYFVTGHGEPDLDGADETGFSALRGELEAEGIEVAALNLLTSEAVPSDASAVVLASPVTPLAVDEVDRLATYLESGGAGIIMFDPMPELERESPELVAWLADRWGVEVRNDIVIDGNSYVNPMPTVPLVSSYGVGPIANGMGDVATYFVEARSIRQIDDVGAVYNSVVQTSSNSWGESSWEELMQPEMFPQYDEGEDLAGPIDIGVTLEDSQSGTRLVLFGDANFCMNMASQDLGNADLFINALNWLIEDEELISIRPQEDVERFVIIRSFLVRNALFAVLVVLIPLTVVGIGVLVFVARKVGRPK